MLLWERKRLIIITKIEEERKNNQKSLTILLFRLPSLPPKYLLYVKLYIINET